MSTLIALNTMYFCLSRSQSPTPKQDTIAALFAKYAGEDGKMDYKELKQFLSEATMRGQRTVNLYLCFYSNYAVGNSSNIFQSIMKLI